MQHIYSPLVCVTLRDTQVAPVLMERHHHLVFTVHIVFLVIDLVKIVVTVCIVALINASATRNVIILAVSVLIPFDSSFLILLFLLLYPHSVILDCCCPHSHFTSNYTHFCSYYFSCLSHFSLWRSALDIVPNPLIHISDLRGIINNDFITAILHYLAGSRVGFPYHLLF